MFLEPACLPGCTRGLPYWSYFRAVGKPIFAEAVEIAGAAKALWEADFVVMSHGTEEDPVFNYGMAPVHTECTTG